jgi:AhpD family alkylhydroperoxidase
MRLINFLTAVAAVGLSVSATCAYAAGEKPPVSLGALNAKVKERAAAKPRVTLAEGDTAAGLEVDAQELLEAGRIPNYLRALSAYPGGPTAFAHLFRSVLYTGELEPELKLGMALRIAQAYDAPYVAGHVQRLLRASARGQDLLAYIQSEKFARGSSRDDLALKYADWLTQDVHGVSDENFQKVRGHFNDSQIVELTLTVCFFNYFTRFSEALRLPVEPWVLNSSAVVTQKGAEPPVERVGLISDAEIKATREMDAALKDPKSPASSWRIGFANSMRAMLRCPEIAQAWRDYGSVVRQTAAIDRNLQLQVSFAVSMANGCRYCTLHQVLGLHRLGVSVTKLMEMKKNDDALTAQELTAVFFARKLTKEPGSATDEDYAALRTEFGEKGALDVVLQTSAFAFMNRFTDGLRLPSEDEAIRVYQEVYGTAWKKPEKAGN